MTNVASKSTLSYFTSSFVVTVLALVLGYFMGGLAGVAIVAVLAVLETSLSFDNAVVNASVLKNWDEKWRKRFIVWGIPIAVFGMRLVFPLAIVAILAKVGPIEVIRMAIQEPALYAAKLTSVHHQVAAFGGSFLLMVALQYFFEKKQVYWWEWAEAKLAKAGDLNLLDGAITLAVILGVGLTQTPEHALDFIVAGIAGLIAYILAKGLGDLLGGGEEEEGGNKVVKASIGGFLYLELLDASFSFDGVIGAFALSNNLFIITTGLMVGAMFVRSLTLLFVDKDTLSEYRYLEHGAFWAIAVLAAIMFASVSVDIPEVVTGLLGAGLIIWAFVHSLIANKREASTVQP